MSIDSEITKRNSPIAAARSNDVLELVRGNEYVLQDLPRWQAIHANAPRDVEEAFVHFWTDRQEFRSVIRYRVMREGSLKNGFQAICGGKPWLFVTNLYLSCNEIGPGFYIEHGFSTIVWAKKIGANFRLNQNVTIGTGKKGFPTLGSNVSVYTGAIVIGGITVGDNVKIGAGAVCNEDVPDNCTVVPAKSRIIQRTR